MMGQTLTGEGGIGIKQVHQQGAAIIITCYEIRSLIYHSRIEHVKCSNIRIKVLGARLELGVQFVSVLERCNSSFHRVYRIRSVKVQHLIPSNAAKQSKFDLNCHTHNINTHIAPSANDFLYTSLLSGNMACP